ncbi:glycerate kinase [Candidatus Caldatribacterium sp.]|uniref:glycerate kinase family protein n=1 Tax=Candidatus Caldatribacterium sp. TaxID=2282143 RepID=UPI00383E40D3|nr:glycerate kinase [Candidatus Caldatribacterium sp.]
MRIVVCPDSFKGSLESPRACEAIRRGLLWADPRFEVCVKPLADGGEGTVAATVFSTGGRTLELEVTGPLWEKVRAQVGLLPDGTCILELAQAAGLSLVPKEQRNPRYTTTYGVGEMLRWAFERGFRKIVLGVGGSATCDGGMGALTALGVRFLDALGRELEGVGENLPKVARIDVSGLCRPPEGTEVFVASDVTNPLYGPLGAASVFGPQKGASPEDVSYLDQGLRHFARVVERYLKVRLDELSGGGAAGGIAAGLYAFLGAQVTSGIRLIAELVHLEESIAGADLVLTGEGRVDRQTFFGKVVSGVLEICRKYCKPLVVLSGGILWEELPELPEEIAGIFSIVHGPLLEEEAMANAAVLLERLAFSLGRLVKKLR